ncbi:heavy-metal-associated domain-containing protein [Halobacteriovorax sp. HLS]|uniref:heavy-metal-associated domain-containing protein n=1 Tax=Halobacteriovorax sp. HLS TaxID=2234000 RepID=UPI000FD8D4BE|nr:heavy-metal-associated domain-containing protein [Halobacteriovorax sp. HLS]
MKKIEFNVDGINCNSCVNKIKNHFADNNMISCVDVSIENKSVLIELDDSISNMATKKELEDLGFSILSMKKISNV